MNNDLNTKNSISAVILSGGKTDDALLTKCLNSVSWCNQTVKIDTNKINGSFAKWRNEAKRLAKCEWLFYVDSDEYVTPELKTEIIKVLKTGDKSAYAIPRRNFFLGREMKWGGWKPDYVIRLINKYKLVNWVGELHEQPKIDGEIGYLKEALIHNTHRNLTDMLDKTNEWSEIEAKLLFAANHPPMNFFRFFSAGFREFWYRGILKLGFLDGTIGIIEIIYQTFSRLITYSKLWELQIKNNKK